jgi:hypothetical protein
VETVIVFFLFLCVAILAVLGFVGVLELIIQLA